MLAAMTTEVWAAIGVGTSTNLLTLVAMWAVWRKQQRERALMEPVTQQEYQDNKKEVDKKLENIRAERVHDTEGLRSAMATVSERVAGVESRFDLGFKMITKSLDRIEQRLSDR